MKVTKFIKAARRMSVKRAERILKAVTAKGPAILLATVPASSNPDRDMSGQWYSIRRGADGNVYCSCPSWRFQRLATADRTCKHIDRLAAAIRKSA